jgi:septal ring factor EnvC (AmiA/AmiB activator)
MTPRNPTDPLPAAAEPRSPQLDPKALAAGRRAAMLRPARRIRRSVAAAATAIFVAAFLAIYVQLASGHDPALSQSSKTANGSSSLIASTSRTSEAAANAAAAKKAAAAKRAAAAKKAAAKRAAAERAEAAAAESESSSASGESAAPVTTSQS